MTARDSRRTRWQVITVALLVVGYSGYYLCRSNLSVTLPLILDELEAGGLERDLAKIRMGTAVSLGVLAYAIGKFLSGAIADFFGGRRNFLAGLVGSTAFTWLFAAGGGLPLFTFAWIGNRLVQSMGWVGMVKITSRWFSFSAYGTVMGVISLSFLFGDAAARQFMAALIGLGLGWRGVFVAAGATLFAIALAAAAWLRESPRELGLEEPAASPQNLFAGDGDPSAAAPSGLRELLRPFLRSPAFGLVCLLSLGFTLMREAFNTWTPTYFTESVGLSQAEAASWSALFPFTGGVSVLLAGWLSDRMGRGGRALIIFCGLLATTVALLALAGAGLGGAAAIGAVALVAFLMIGPYSYLAGAISLDFGGKRGSATACGIIDGVGYLGAVLAGEGVARLSVRFGWEGAFGALAGVGALSTAVAALFWWNQGRRAQRRRPVAGAAR